MNYLTNYEADEQTPPRPALPKCGHCRKPIADIPVYVSKLTAKATRFSPEEWDEVPMHVDCGALVTSREYQDYCDEMDSLRGYSDEERSRI
jgi:hypothetical protein